VSGLSIPEIGPGLSESIVNELSCEELY